MGKNESSQSVHKSPELLIELVKHDRECRGVGITETYQVTDDYPLGREKIKRNSDKKANDVLELLFDNCATLKAIGPEYFLAGKLCIAGDAVVWALNDKSSRHKLKDCDLFFTGVTSAIVADIIKKQHLTTHIVYLAEINTH